MRDDHHPLCFAQDGQDCDLDCARKGLIAMPDQVGGDLKWLRAMSVPYIGGPDDAVGRRFREIADRLERAEADKEAAIQKARADALADAVRPWADFHGDLPDYDHPLRPVFESGIQYAVELLAKVLKVADYEVCDGTEEFDGDLGGTLFNIVIETWPKNEHGDWIDLRDPDTRASLAIRPLTASEVSREG